MAFIRERRRLVDSRDIKDILDDTHWLAFECAVEKNGDVVSKPFWKVLIVSYDEEPMVVFTSRNAVSRMFSGQTMLNRLQYYYPNVETFELPAVLGAIAPSRHPEFPSGPRFKPSSDPV